MKTFNCELEEYLRRDDLLQASLSIGKIDDPNFEIEPYVEKIMSLAANLWKRVSRHRKDPLYIIEKMNQILFDEMKFVGKNHRYKKVIDNADQYYLHKLFDTKKGSPLTFAILYQVLSEQMGLESEVLSFPSHFFLRIEDLEESFYVDPFDHGRVLSESEFQRKFRASMQRNRLLSTNLYEKVGTTQLVARIIQQLKHVFVLKNDALRALRAVELLTVLFPDSAELTRDRGILYCEMEYFSKAMEDLRSYLKRCPKADDIKEIKKLTSMLRGYRETIN